MVKKAQVPGLPVQETNETLEENQESQDQEQEQQEAVSPIASKPESTPQQSNKPQLTDKGWLVPERGK